MTDPLILGIESSCDETGVAVLEGFKVRSFVLASQTEEHARFGQIFCLTKSLTVPCRQGHFQLHRKPNADPSCNALDRVECLENLRSSGRIRQYPIHSPSNEFLNGTDVVLRCQNHQTGLSTLRCFGPNRAEQNSQPDSRQWKMYNNSVEDLRLDQRGDL